MLENKIRTPEEITEYMLELKAWLSQERNKPVEQMADFFSKRIDNYDQVHLHNWAEEYAHIADYFDGPIASLLDLGCGTGLELASIYQKFPDIIVTGIDLSEDMMDRLRVKYADKEINLIRADYFTYPLAAEEYDAVLSFETLHHFPYHKKQKIYEKIFRTLKRGGYYLECDYIACCLEEEAVCLEQYEFKRRESHIADDVFIHIDIPLTLEHQIELMEHAGFREVQVLYENKGTMIIKAEK